MTLSDWLGTFQLDASCPTKLPRQGCHLTRRIYALKVPFSPSISN